MTTATAPALPGLERDHVAALIDWAIATRSSVHLVGPHGVGKTSYVRALAAEHGLRVVEKSLPVCSQRDFCVPLPVRDPRTGGRHLEVVVLQQLLQADPDDRYILVLDEFSRADRATLNTAMELLQEHTIAGQQLPGLAAVIAIDNPAGDDEYTGVNELDLAQADRVATLEVTAQDIPWRRHLATVHDRDLTEFLHVWDTLDTGIRRTLCPRVLDHLLALVDAGLPPSWALPVLASGRQTLLDADGNDVTEQVLARLAAAAGPATEQAPAAEERVTAAIRLAVEHGWKLRLVGPPGIGKTSHIRQAIAAAGYDLEYLSLSQTSVADLVVPVPVAGSLEFLPAARLVRPGRRYVLVLDEFSRAQVDAASAAMELVNERSIAGRRLDGCVAVIALDNPAEAGGLHFDAGRIDAAQASRFTATIEVAADDLPWRDVLLDRYPDRAPTFLDWRAEDLDDAGRALVSPRCLERMLSLHQAGLDVELGLPVLAGERIPVPVAALRRRINGDRSVGLASILTDLDQHVERLNDDCDRTQLAVLHALGRADIASLRAATDAIGRLLAALHPNHRLSLLRQAGNRRGFWIHALQDLNPERSHA